MNIKPKASIAITGEWPGAGQSTTAKMLAKELRMTRVYAGFLFRKFGHVWDLQKSNVSWEQFEQQIANDLLDLDGIPFQESDFNEKKNRQFQLMLQSSDYPKLWDQIIDLQSLKALNQPGMLVEAKIGVVLDKINLPTKLDPKNHTIFKILLRCDPKVAATRIIKRKIENGELSKISKNTIEYKNQVDMTQKDLTARHLEDWRRYEEIYNINRDMLYSDDIFQVDTSDIDQPQVIENIVKHISSRS